MGLTSGLRDRDATATPPRASSSAPTRTRRKQPNALAMRGVAPGAELIPLRTNTGVIIGEARGLQLAMAIRRRA